VTHNPNQQFYHEYASTPQDKSRGLAANAYGISAFQTQKDQGYENKLPPPMITPP